MKQYDHFKVRDENCFQGKTSKMKYFLSIFIQISTHTHRRTHTQPLIHVNFRFTHYSNFISRLKSWNNCYRHNLSVNKLIFFPSLHQHFFSCYNLKILCSMHNTHKHYTSLYSPLMINTPMACIVESIHYEYYIGIVPMYFNRLTGFAYTCYVHIPYC